MTIANISGTASFLRRARTGNLTVVSGDAEVRVYRHENGQPIQIASVTDTDNGPIIKVLSENVTVER